MKLIWKENGEMRSKLKIIRLYNNFVIRWKKVKDSYSAGLSGGWIFKENDVSNKNRARNRGKTN